MTAVIDLSGQRFGRLVVEGRCPSTGGQARWECTCDCGAATQVVSQALRSGAVVSCGCLKNEKTKQRFTKHGEAGPGRRSPEYTAWSNMIRRCENPDGEDFHLYGARGVKVWCGWRTSFEAFLAGVGRRPGPGFSLDRIETNGNYEPGNVRWATASTQANNKRNNRLVELDGQRMTLGAAIELANPAAPRSTIHARLAAGWPADAALSTPVLEIHGKRRAGSHHY